ncbi:MAG: hypothetical protein IJ849_04810 [Selenomonadaceae bacterium]|nr:hypothetical protein [Selenomonadaceae bacterium]
MADINHSRWEDYYDEDEAILDLPSLQNTGRAAIGFGNGNGYNAMIQATNEALADLRQKIDLPNSRYILVAYRCANDEADAVCGKKRSKALWDIFWSVHHDARFIWSINTDHRLGDKVELTLIAGDVQDNRHATDEDIDIAEGNTATLRVESKI